MGKSLDNIAKDLKNSDKKVQLIYAFNGVGKTRLSRTFKDLVSPKQDEETNSTKVVYYNAFTEDLFYWDNDLDEDRNRRLKIHPNDFTHWVLVDEGKEDRIISLFQHYETVARYFASFGLEKMQNTVQWSLKSYEVADRRSE